MAANSNAVDLHYAPDGTWRTLTAEEQAMLDVGALIALRHDIGSHVYREPIAIIAPTDWCPGMVTVMALPVWRSEHTAKPALVYAP